MRRQDLSDAPRLARGVKRHVQYKAIGIAALWADRCGEMTATERAALRQGDNARSGYYSVSETDVGEALTTAHFQPASRGSTRGARRNMAEPQRIVSLLPSSTEILCALGLETSLVGISHVCDYPPGVTSLPRLTAPA